MGLMSRTGATDSTLTPNIYKDAIGTTSVPSDTPGLTPGTNPVTTATDYLQNLPQIRDPALDRLTFDTSQYISTLTSLQGYNKGTRVQVIYFQQLNENWNRRSNTVDTPTMRNNLSMAYRRINDYEITLPEPWNYDFNQSNASSTLTGTALLYPGMNPKVGDVFYANVGDSILGQFKVTTIRPMTWRTQRAYEIGFFLYQFPGSIDVLPEQSQTVQTLYFSKANYLGDTTALLTQSQTLDLQTLANLRDTYAKAFYREFFNDRMNSFTIPETANIYDPYIVKFVNLIMPYMVVKRRALQLYPQVDESYDNTIWSVLNDKEQIDLSQALPNYRSYTYTVPNMGVGISTLTNRDFILVDQVAQYDYNNTDVIPSGVTVSLNDQDMLPPWVTLVPFAANDYYVFSQDFYQANTPGMSAVEQIIYTAITTRQYTDTQTLITTLKSVKASTDPRARFYQIPALLKVIDIAASSVANMSTTSAAAPTIP